MPINFPGLLQDSWNFIRNQRAFLLYGFGCLLLVQIIALRFLPNMPMNASMPQNSLSDNLLPILISGAVNIFVTTLLILNIKAINNGEFERFFQFVGEALRKLPTVIALNIIMVLPLSLGMSFQMFGVAPGSGLTIIVLPLIISGIFVFVRLCLGAYAYLVEELDGVSESIGFMWNLGRGRTWPLVSFCFITHFVPQFLTLMVANIGGVNIFTVVFTVLLSAFLNLFVTVFSFRFYQAYSRPIART